MTHLSHHLRFWNEFLEMHAIIRLYYYLSTFAQVSCFVQFTMTLATLLYIATGSTVAQW